MTWAGGDLFLTQDPKSFNMEDDATQVALLRQATKNILYTVANSNIMSITVDGYLMPIWKQTMFIIDAVLIVLLGIKVDT